MITTKLKIGINALLCSIFLASCAGGGESSDLFGTLKLFPVKIDDDIHTTFCYITKDGEVVIEGDYDYANMFYDGVALVKTQGEFRYINEKGEYINPESYNKATDFSEGIAFVRKYNGEGGVCENFTAINTKGEDVFDLKAKYVVPFREGLAAFKTDDDWGFIDKSGKVVIQPTIPLHNNYPLYFSQGKLPVPKDGKWGVMDKKGNMVIDYGEYEMISAFDEDDQAVVKTTDGKHAIIDSKGEYVLAPQSEYFDIQRDGDLYRYTGYSDSNGRYVGWLNKKGLLEVFGMYANDHPHFSGTDLALATLMGDKRGYIKRTGLMSLYTNARYGSPFMGDVALIGEQSFCFINKKGDEISNRFSALGGGLYDLVAYGIDSRFKRSLSLY